MGGDKRDFTSRHINAFLTKVHELDRLQKFPTNTCVFVINVYLFTLLNILDIIEEVRVDQSVYEGGNMDEGSISKLSKELTT